MSNFTVGEFRNFSRSERPAFALDLRYKRENMRARLRQWAENIDGSFWLRPSLVVLSGIALAELLINLENSGWSAPAFMTFWLYSGGETGARTLLGAVAGSTISVAGTVFSITIATLTLASNQMGPRLLRNFTQDRGNQITLGVFLATFVYALMVLRSVRGADQGAFVPHLAITGAILLSLLCVAMLVYFVNHVASQINFDTVIDLVYRDLGTRLEQFTASGKHQERLAESFWDDGFSVFHESSGYVQQLDADKLADWAENHGVALRLHARIGDFIFPGAPLARVKPGGGDVGKALHQALALGAYPTPSGDLEYAVEQLVDIAVRALSPGVNDPRTAMRILDRLGAALCMLAGKKLPTGAVARRDRVVLQTDITTYDGLMDAMFHLIRQSASGSAAVMIYMADIFIKVAQCERDGARCDALRRHAQLIAADGQRDIANPEDRNTLKRRLDVLQGVLETGRP